MLFTSPIFLAFFAVVFAIAWLERSHRRHKLWLLLASYLFYAGWDWRFLSLIWISTAVDYVVGRRLAALGDDAPRARRAWLLVSLVVNLGLLGFFKYFGFFVDSAAAALGLEAGDRALSIVLPVGISFYTFQTLSYTIDVYRRRLEPVASPLDFALFVAFFPQLVAGPIERAAHFLPQLRQRPAWVDVAVRRCLGLFLLGFVKKVAIADNLAPTVDRVFADPSLWGAGAVWIAVALYAAQIYCDFSGYTDMAIATAGLLGYRLDINFRFPYLAVGLSDFWRRWHVSLSTWLRDYLYIPLGGNRGSRWATRRNLMLTMLLGGLWHGAAWTFVVWGGLHGVALVAAREARRWRRRRAENGVLPTRRGTPGVSAPLAPAWSPGLVPGLAATLWWVLLTWIFFRATSFEDAWTLTRAFVFFDGAGTLTLAPLWALAPPALWLLHWLGARGWPGRWVDRLPDPAFAAGYGATWALALAFVPMRSEPFIYFQF